MLADAVKNGGCLLRFDGGDPVSVLMHKELRLKLGGADHKGEYIFGLCTAPEHRCGGYASSLVEEICAESGSDFAVLIPENEDLYEFYGRLGFTPGGRAASFRACAAKSSPVSVVSGSSAAYAAYIAAAEKYDGICLLSERDFAASAAISPQTCVIGENGVCLVSSAGVEVFAPAESAVALAASALELCGVSEARAICPLSSAPDGAETVRIGMIRSLRGETPPESFYINNLFNL